METLRNYHSVTVTVVVVLGKPERIVLPLVFLQLVLDHNLQWIRVVARRPGETTWEIPGIKPISLPDEFLEKLQASLQRQPVVDWLCYKKFIIDLIFSG